jgi:hypothetical protein
VVRSKTSSPPKEPRVSARAKGDVLRAAPRKRVPFDFVLDELDGLAPVTRPMFGCTAVYVGERIVMVLRERPGEAHDDGVVTPRWTASCTSAAVVVAGASSRARAWDSFKRQ